MLRLEEVSSSHNYKMKMEIDEEERRFEKSSIGRHFMNFWEYFDIFSFSDSKAEIT